MKAKLDIRTLKVKALECAIKSIKNAATPAVANIVYKKWEAFHDNWKFKEAIKDKQLKFAAKWKITSHQRTS